MSSNRLRIALLIFTVLLISAGWWWWNRNLTADPPMNFSGISQSLSTDPALYTYHARNRILFGQADPLGDSRWILFEKSFAGMLATFWFRMTSPSIEHGREIGIFLSFAALVLFLLGLWRHHRPWVLSAVAFVYLSNAILFVYGRYPFLEISLMFFAGLAFFVYSHWGDRWWGLCLAAILVALATFTGKVFGVLLLPALFGADWVTSARETRGRRLGIILVTFLLVSALLIVTLYGSSIMSAFGFLREQTYETRGVPYGLTSPLALIESIISFGFKSGIYFDSPELLVFLVVSLVLLLLGMHSRPKFLAGLPRTTIFSLFWVLLTWCGFAPQTMCPTRYVLTFIPAVTILFFTLIDHLHAHAAPLPVKISWRQTVAVGIIAWVFSTQVILRVAQATGAEIDTARYVLYALPVGAALAVAARLIIQRVDIQLKQRTFAVVTVLALAGTIGSVIYTYSFAKLGDRQYSIITANKDLGMLLGAGAVVSGPYAAAITQENGTMSHPHFFGESWSDSSYFVRLPITHLAVDQSNFDLARKQSRSLESARPVAGFWIGSHEITVFNISQVYDNPAANKYQFSPYERAEILYDANQFDSTLRLLSRYPDLVRNSLSAALLYSRAMFRANHDSDAVQNYLFLHRLYPTDFQVTLEAANALHQIGEIRNDTSLLQTAMNLYQSATAINPYEGQKVIDLYQQTDAYFKALKAKRPGQK